MESKRTFSFKLTKVAGIVCSSMLVLSALNTTHAASATYVQAEATATEVAASTASAAASTAQATATAASTAASDASAAASTAQATATAASTAASDASDAASTAQATATAASTAASDASDAASDASDAAAMADSKAESASIAAATAQATATAASTAAATAGTDASDASGAASTADSKAVVASTAASTADSKAVVARTAASTADSKAVVASTAASTADSKAVVASTAASTADSKAVVADSKAVAADSKAVSAGAAAAMAQQEVDALDTDITTGTLNVKVANVGADGLTVTGDTTLESDLGVTGDTTLTGALDVDGDTTLDDTTVDGTLNVNGITTLDGTTVDGTLNVNGITTLDGTLDVTGAAGFDSTMRVNGQANFNGGINADGGVFTVEDDTGNVHTSGDLNVDGITTLDDTTVDGTLNVKGDIANLNSEVTTINPITSGGVNDYTATFKEQGFTSTKGDTDAEHSDIVQRQDSITVTVATPGSITATDDTHNGLYVGTESTRLIGGQIERTSFVLDDQGATFSNIGTGGPVTVTGVADGQSDYDAVNFRQLTKVSKGVSMSMAMGGIPQAANGQGSIGLGAAQFNGHSALAIGASYHDDENHMIYNIKGAQAGSGDNRLNAGSMGIGWSF